MNIGLWSGHCGSDSLAGGWHPPAPPAPGCRDGCGPWMCSWNSLGQAGSCPTDIFQLPGSRVGDPLCQGSCRAQAEDSKQEQNSKMWWANKAGVCLQHLQGACRPGHPQIGSEWGLGAQGDSSRLLPSHPTSRGPRDLGCTHMWHRGLVAVAAGRLGRAGFDLRSKPVFPRWSDSTAGITATGKESGNH